ncbi:hypothetical protein KGP36_03295 [Patescibacteria group bacterium]|nr:hypothetical protein [Patescibacteria group bacterium]
MKMAESPAEKAAREKAEQEERIKAQIPFDPAKHGVGTAPVVEPESVKELFHKVVKPLMQRVEALEKRLSPKTLALNPAPDSTKVQ